MAKNEQQKPEVLIHVMPKDFVGREASMGEGKKVAEPKKTPVPAPVAPAVPSTPQKPPVKRQSRLPAILIIVGIVLLAVLGGGALFILKSLNPAEEEPEPIVQPDPIPEPVEPDPIQQPAITQGRDLDSDGLTDREEALYGTDFRNPDTDGDTFLDGNEVFHRYDPLGYSPSTLLDTGSVIEYIAADDEYKLTYPRTWTLSTTIEGLTLRSATGSSVELITQPKSTDQTFEEWFSSIYDADRSISELQQGRTKSEYISHMSTDELETFVIFDDVVYVFVYNLGTSQTIDYLQTFQMIINSFEVL